MRMGLGSTLGLDEAMAEHGAAGIKYIAGVPIYNYNLARARHEQRVVSLLELGEEERTQAEVSWNVIMKSTATHEKMDTLCKRLRHGCTFEGKPEEQGLPLLELEATEPELESLLKDGSSEVDFVEPDLEMFTIPEIPPSEDDDAPESTMTSSMAEQFGSRTKIPWGDLKRFGKWLIGWQSKPSWGLERIGVSNRGPHAATGKGVHVYVLDTGVRTTHEEFGGRAIPTIEVLWNDLTECNATDTSCAMDENGHGTHCAGTVAGKNVGVAPEATIHAVKVFTDTGRSETSWWCRALEWIMLHGSKPAVVSMSFTGEGESKVSEAVIKKVVDSGITVVAAAGNEAYNACGFYPGNEQSAITVGATDWYGSKASYSNYGECLDIYAPGSDIVSLSHSTDDELHKLSGTSMAAPHVSGAIALLLEENVDPTKVKQKMIEHSEKGSISHLGAADPNVMLYVGYPTGTPPKKGMA